MSCRSPHLCHHGGVGQCMLYDKGNYHALRRGRGASACRGCIDGVIRETVFYFILSIVTRAVLHARPPYILWLGQVLELQ